MKFLYTGAFRFPNQDAAAKRVINISKALPIDVDIDFAGWEDDYKGENCYTYQGYECFSQGEFSAKKNAIKRLISFLFRGWRTFNWLIKREKYDGIILYNPPLFFSIFMLLYCKFKGIKLILDSTEWYESEHLIGGYYGLASIENYLRMNCAYPLFKNAIVISNFLAKHFEKSNIKNIITILPISESFEARRHVSSVNTKLVYIGNLGKKDKLDSICDFLIHSEKNITLDIAGIDETDFFITYPHLLQHKNELGNLIQFHGRINSERVRDLYLQADFSVFFREKKRYALAGFPTKFIESICYSVPVITNPIGDIVDYAGGVTILINPCDLQDKLNSEIDKSSVTIQEANFKKLFDTSFSIQSVKPELSSFIAKVLK